MIAFIIGFPFLFALLIIVLLYLTRKTRTRINFFFSAYHWGDRENLPLHGPASWPLWRLVWFRWCVLDVWPPTTGRRLWLYTRWGALVFDVHFDRRSQVQS